MFLDQKDLKSKFLQKKNKEKKKIQQNQQYNTNILKIQKVARAYLVRRNLEKQLLRNDEILRLLLMKNQLNQVQESSIAQIQQQLLQRLYGSFEEEQKSITRFYLKKLILALIKSNDFVQMAYKTVQSVINMNNSKFLHELVKSDQFISLINSLLQQKSGSRLLNLTAIYMYETGSLLKVDKEKIFCMVRKGFSSNKIEQQSVHSEVLKVDTIIVLLNFLYEQKYTPQPNFQNFDALANAIRTLLKPFDSPFSLEPSLSLLICFLINCIKSEQSSLVKQITDQYNNILVLMQDQEDLIYFENKILSHQKMQIFSSVVLKIMQEIFQSTKITKMFFDTQREESRLIKEVMIESIRMLGQMFQDRKILFLRSLLSSNELLTELFKEKKPQFYEGLKMRLLAMDDEEFKKFDLFTVDQWKSIITYAISQSLKKITKLIKSQNGFNNNYKKLVPFANKNEQTVLLNTLSESLELLYKKSLRTKKLSPQIFISKQLTQAFYQFNFGTGAQVMERLLKMYPFAFTFESRIQKFKQLIKQDKLKHNRTLFLQEDVDDDLIIHVRRGKQFLDAYHSMVHKDLRKKYKLVFFNEQGLQQEGIDGGGLIKEFINRVLKSAFSDVYGLFYENSQNQLLPNPQSPANEEYEFIGKIIGKAVYESITIQQKFVEPFMNLVIGRKNVFEDIQYIDPAIYQSLIGLKKMPDEELEDMQQTFVIQDQLPGGRTKYVNLLCPSKPVKGTEDEFALVTRQNKLQFIMAYSDYKCTKQLEQKTRSFRKGFLKVLKPQWLTLFNNQELNLIISGGEPNFDVNELKKNCVYTDYHEKSLSIAYFWEILKQFAAEQKSQFLLYVTSCSRPPTLGFGSMKPKICISRDQNTTHLPTANTCMNVFRLPDYKDKELMKKKMLYAIYSKAGFEFA